MTTPIRLTSLSAAIFVFASISACNVHDNTINIPNATINATADTDVSNVAPTQSVAITVVAQNIYLVDPSATPPPEHVNDAGYLQIYLDSTDTAPLLVTAQTMFSVTIPAGTAPGPHNLVCRFHKHDGTPTTTEVNVAITVTASASVGADGGVDASVGVDASITIGAGGASGAAGAGG